MNEKQQKILREATMRHFVKKNKGWRIVTTTTADGDKIPLITTDLRTKEGRALYRKALELTNL